MKLIGLATLGRDAEIRVTPAGDPVANLALAFNYGKKDGNGERPTTWIDASLWGDRAEKLAEWLTKGRQFYVEVDDVHIETYEGRNGPGAKIVGRVAQIEFTRGGDRQEGQNQQRQQSRQQGRQQSSGGDYQRTRDGNAPRQQNDAGHFGGYDESIPF